MTSNAYRTQTGTEIHRAFEGSSRTNCGCRINSAVSIADMLKAQQHGALCAKCWGPRAALDTPAEWAERAARLVGTQS